MPYCCGVVCVIVILWSQEIKCLQLVSLQLPNVVISGEPAWLNCTYDLETDALYAVKWYKNETEFYRYVPRDVPPAQTYNLPGVYIDLDKSHGGHVYLKATDMDSEGTYRCEASAEAPSFQTVMGEKKMKVYVIPHDGPDIEGIQPKYDVGDNVNVTCRSSPSQPAAIVHWFINGKEPPEDFLTAYPESERIGGLISSMLGLYFEVTPEHFIRDTLTLRCSAIISNNYSLSSEEIIIGGGVSPSSPYPSLGSNKGPIITGGYSAYRINDVVDVNCSSTTSKTPAFLRWFINENQAYNRYLVNYPFLLGRDGTITNVLGLRFVVRKKHFQNGEMHLKCTSTLSEVMNMTTREEVFGSHHKNSGFHASESKAQGNGVQPIRSYFLPVPLIVVLAVKRLTKPV
ncbi:uncharacterized protein LOC106471194 [Limulus polyphemus]|uniref:Uncharacterized protein LOC106471194 n=1 Tax=Limulus polyphemus TaxID=6850 RepID=A0ABM1TI21_LIMPO|nr:uncharacterized protein LOC106471194 [Limulus polyphemus]